jgi:hypothetical protein
MAVAAAAASASKVDSMMARVALECGGDISASQEEILANAPFLGGDNGLPASAPDDDEEVFSTPPDATQQQDDTVTMCTLPFTPTPSETPAPPSDDAEAVLAPPSSKPQSPAPPSSKPHSPAPASSDDDDAAPVNPRRKPRICTRKVRGARIRTPTPSPEQQQPEQQPEPEQPPPQPEQPVHVDPLVRAVLMIPTRTTTAAGTAPASSGKQDAVEDFLALARQKGLI